MLCDIYIEALLVDEKLADQVWDAGKADDLTAAIAWMLIVGLDRTLTCIGRGSPK